MTLNGLKGQGIATRSKGLLLLEHLDAHCRQLIPEDIVESTVSDHHELVIISLPHFAFFFPAAVIPGYQPLHPVLHEGSRDIGSGVVEGVAHPLLPPLVDPLIFIPPRLTPLSIIPRSVPTALQIQKSEAPSIDCQRPDSLLRKIERA